MYNFLALLSGLAISVMVSINGNLSQKFGVFWATVIVHAVGTGFAFLLCKIKKDSIPGKLFRPRWIYIGGAIGVLTVVFNNLAYGHISMTSIIALGLLGQTAASLVIDSFGLFGMEKCPFRKSVYIGLAFSAAGIAVMMDQTVTMAVYAVIFSFLSGITVVLSRTVNARLAQNIGEMQSSFVNHLVGLFVSVFAALLMMRIIPAGPPDLQGTRPWMYAGGMLGVTAVYLCNIIVPRLPAFRLTLLTFVAQVFTGIIIDLFVMNTYSKATFTGGVIVACGMALNLLVDKLRS